MSIKIEADLRKFGQELNLFNDKHKEAVVKSVRRAIKRSVTPYRKNTKKLIQRNVRLPRAVPINKIVTKFAKTGGFNINKMLGQVRVSSKPISLIHFVKGKKSPARSKGVKVSRRKPLRFMIKPGKTTKGNRRFIAKGKGGNYQVFQRRGKKSNPITKQNATNPAWIVRDQIKIKRLKLFGALKLQKEYEKSLAHLLSKM